jgi:LacI family transcriptional regulator
MKFGQVTIKDIARELGISPSTVSRALKDHPDISSETKRQVNALAEKLSYQPNTVALNLRKSKTNTIGVVIPEIVHFFFSTIISGIEETAHEAGYNVILTQSDENYEREVADVKDLFNSRVDGLLISMSRETKTFDHISALMNRGLPVVFYDRSCPDENTSKVIVDDYAGAREAVQHLIEQGCRRIAHLQAAPGTSISEGRLQGYMDALREADMPIAADLIIPCVAGNLEEGFEVGKKLLAMKNRTDGVFANNDLMAMGAMKTFKEKGVRVPADIAVVGFSNWFFSQLMDPPLSSVDQPGFEMGQRAAGLLIAQIEKINEGESAIVPETITLKTRLIIRESSRRK